jgi:hypothetical protein
MKEASLHNNTLLETPFEPGDTIDGWGTYVNELQPGSATIYGRVYLVEFTPDVAEEVSEALGPIFQQWQQHPSTTYQVGETTNSAGNRQVKVLLKAGSFMVFEHCDSAIRNAAILRINNARLMPITSWFIDLEELSRNE